LRCLLQKPLIFKLPAYASGIIFKLLKQQTTLLHCRAEEPPSKLSKFRQSEVFFSAIRKGLHLSCQVFTWPKELAKYKSYQRFLVQNCDCDPQFLTS